jgi:two-component system sensor kinase FixL
MYSRESLALMDATIDAVIVIDHRGHMTAVNEATRRLFGYRTDELLGHNVSMLMPEPDRERHDEYIARYLKTGEARIIGIGREVIAQRKDGSLVRVRLSVGRVPDAVPPRFVGLLRDITAEWEATAALKLERDRANAYLELNDAILLMLDEHRRIREINARGSDLLGAPRDEIHGRDWLDLISGENERERARLLLASALSNGASREREFDGLNFAGEPRRIYWRCIARRGVDGAPSGWLLSGNDVTDRLRREEDAALAQERLTRVARLATMGELASGVAHELNQPLTAIATYARACDRYLASPQPDFGELREAVREIGAEGLRAGRIIHRLRELVRNDTGETRAAIDVNAALEELRALLGADARAYETRLEIDFGAQLPRVEGNAQQLQQVVLNLVRNAFEALVDVAPDNRKVSLTTSQAPGTVEIRVTDSGPGIPPAIQDRLFHPFVTTKKNGTGLGLAMSRTIVRSHGGSIGMEGSNPHGTSVFVRLPALEGNARDG